DSTTYANSQVNVGGNTTLDIGNDLNIKGGVLNTDKIQGVIGGDMTIESLQDTATYDSDQKNMGFSADLDLAKGAGSSLSVNGGKTNVNADYQAVGEQSGVFTGDGGIDLTTEGTTNLIGGAITTTDKALQNGLNNYVSKGGITTQDIENTTSYEGDAISAGVSIGNTTGKPQATMNGIGYGTDSDSDSSVTRAGITGVAGNSDITTDNRAEYAGALENVFDANRVNEELGAQTQITQDFGKEAPKAVAEFSQNQIDAIKANPDLSIDEKRAAIVKWDEGGVYRIAAHTALGALGTGSVEGALSTGGVAAAAPTLNNLQDKIAESLIASGMSESIAKGTASGVVSLALLVAGSASGLDTSSTVTATNVDANNRQLHPDQIKLLKLHAEDYAKEKGITKEEALKILARAAVYNLDEDWYNAYNDNLSLNEIMQFDDANKFLQERNGVQAYNISLVERYNRLNNDHGIVVDGGVLSGSFRNDDPKSYTDSRLYLDEMLTDADSVQFVLDNLALQNPYTYGRTPETAAEVQNAKAEGSNQGAGNLILAPWELAKEGIDKLQDPYGTVIDGFNSIESAIKAIPSVPEKAKQAYEDFTYIGLEDNLAIMQGKGLDVARNDAQSSTELGIGVGLSGFGTASTLAAQAARPKIFFMDSFTESGTTVRHGTNSTAIGDDGNTIRNYENAANTGNGHNVIVHGQLEYDEFGGTPVISSTSTVKVNGGRDVEMQSIPISIEQVSAAVRSNPDYKIGDPVCFGSCWSGSSGTAQELANELGARVLAPTRPVAWNKDTNSWVQDEDYYFERDDIKPEWKIFEPE
ncbi:MULTISPECIES: hemagglutinin repeat-containing protein, partial [unclassified Psychrobacter]|uniref:hemagglutinin repeat-containing protein n=1 Tax=unclassified Psychrobacter TaxID=196806 RepID=UPI00403825E8